jgi:hypothetical protein
MVDDFGDSGMHSTMPERIPVMQIQITLAILGYLFTAAIYRSKCARRLALS